MAQGAKYEPKVVPLGGAIVAVIIAALAGFIIGRVFAGPEARSHRGPSGPTPTAKVDTDKAAQAATEGNPPAQGPADAKVRVVLFSDFKCPFCSRIAPAFTDLAKKFGDRVRIVFRPFPLAMHPGADVAAEAAMAANAQGKFWPYHDLLFGHQDKQDRGDLEAYARQLGLDMTAFTQALDSRQFKPAVDAGVALGKALGVTGTPTLLINSEMVVGPNPAELAGMVQRALDGKPISDASGSGGRQGQARPSAPPPLPSEVKDVKAEAWSPTRGPAAAPIKFVLFCEYLCPFCKRIQPTLQAIAQAYGDRVQFVFRNLIIHGAPAEIPAKASLAAWRQGPDKWSAFHDLLFANQSDVRSGGQDKVEELARQAGLDVDRLRTDMASPEVAQELESDKAAGAAAGASGTPSSFINGRYLSGAVPASYFGAWIDKLLDITTPTLPASADAQQQAPAGGCGN